MEKTQKFEFPFEPYPSQLEYSKTLYNIINSGKIGILESPTGTGKSMAMIIGSLTWLFDNKKNYKKMYELKNNDKKNEDFKEKISEENSKKKNKFPSWLLKSNKENKVKNFCENLKKCDLKFEGEFQKILKVDDVKKNGKKEKKVKKEKLELEFEEEGKNSDDKFLIDYEEEKEMIKTYTKEILKRGLSNSKNSSQADLKNPNFQIIYCTRTHSQIKEFISEIKKTKFSKKIRLVHLASKSHYCVQESIKNCGNALVIEEKCQDKRSKGKCEFYQYVKMYNAKREIYSGENDIEDIVTIGKKNGVCPYYSTKYNSIYADIICVPYASLISPSTRENLNLNLSNSIILFDESHNLAEQFSSLNSVTITYKELTECYMQIKKYLHKYKNRLKSKNSFFLNKILDLLRNFVKIFNFGKREENKDFEILSPSELLLRSDALDFDLGKIKDFIEKSDLSRKLVFFNFDVKDDELKMTKNEKKLFENTEKNQDGKNSQKSENSKMKLFSIEKFITFILKLITGNQTQAKIVLNYKKTALNPEPSAYFLPLDLKSEFREIVDSSISVLFTGGTMQPQGMLESLLEGCGKEVESKEFGHVVEKDNVFLSFIDQCFGKGVCFSYGNLGDNEMFEKLSEFILKIHDITPGGTIIFLPSYKFQTILKNTIKKTYPSKFSNIFFDEKNKNSEIFKNFSKNVKILKKSSLLFSIMGGSLSEGINFKDELARCVITVGMPYPNIKSPEIKLKMDFYDQKKIFGKSKKLSLEEKKNFFDGKKFYESLCIKSINQSIGRAIRHKNDYSAILLVDMRYKKRGYKENLPEWLKSSYQNLDEKNIFEELKEFYKKMSK